MAINQNYPAVSPSFNINFARSKKLDSRITMSRAQTSSNVTYTGSDGLVKYAASDQPRFHHSYNSTTKTTTSLGLLSEPTSTNYVIQSEDVTLWTKPNMVATGNSIVLPNGQTSTTAEWRGETTDANIKMLRPLPAGGNAVAAGDRWVFSVFLRAGTESTCHIALLDRYNSGATGRTFNMATGSWASNQDYSNSVSSGDSGFFEYPNGWYRVWISAVFTQAEPDGHQMYLRLNANSASIALTTSFSAWGAQLEKRGYPTSYFGNFGTTNGVTRSADNISITGTNFSDFYNPQEWTIAIGARRNYSGNFLEYPNLARVNDGTSNNTFGFYGAQGSDQFTNYGVVSNNVSQTDYVARSISTTAPFKMAQTLKLNSSTFCIDGVLTTTDTSVSMPIGVNQMLIGQNWGSTISYITYYPKFFTTTQLQTLTK